MIFPRSLHRGGCCLLIAAGWLSLAQRASAQQQDRIAHILNPDRNLHAEGFGKTFEPGSSHENKSFVTRLFGASHPATVKAGDGRYQAATFNAGKGGFATAGFTTKKLALADQAASPINRTFETKALAVSENRAAGKTAAVQTYGPSGRTFLEEGKRQEDIDDLRRQKNLSIDQVREILNKKKQADALP